MLKSILTLLIFVLINNAVTFAQPKGSKNAGILWMSFEDAVSQNQQQRKKVFIDFYTDWCGWCKRMDATTFKDPSIVAYMNANFFAVKFNAETHDTITYKGKDFAFRKENKANGLAVQMLKGSMSYPTSVYLDEELNEIGPVPGYLTAKQLLPVLKYFSEDIYKTKKWEDYLKENLSR